MKLHPDWKLVIEQLLDNPQALHELRNDQVDDIIQLFKAECYKRYKEEHPYGTGTSTYN